MVAARRRLRDAGIPTDEADLDARLLAEHVLGWTTERYFADANQGPPAGFDTRFTDLITRRAMREPYAYIVGHQEFWGRDFDVTPAVLIPRPETELLVEFVTNLVRTRFVTICDVGTGSGCVAISIALECPSTTIVAVDLSRAALDVARRNADRYKAHVTFIESDLFTNVDGMFDLIVSNPPYVAERDRATTQPEVREYEPGSALFAGPDGLDVIRRLIAHAPDHLTVGGHLVFEFGFGQADAVAELISSAPKLRMIDVWRDLQGIPRAAIAQRI